MFTESDAIHLLKDFSVFRLIKYKTVGEDLTKSVDLDFWGECHVLSRLRNGN